jgi:fermentation-respiration switch protein FrsA (DUF1100 family)
VENTFLSLVCSHSVYSSSATADHGLNPPAQDAPGPYAVPLQIQIHGQRQVAKVYTLLTKYSLTDEATSEVNITKIPPKTPILFLSGAQDEIVPPAHMQELYEHSKSQPDAQRTFVLFEKGSHSESFPGPPFRQN